MQQTNSKVLTWERILNEVVFIKVSKLLTKKSLNVNGITSVRLLRPVILLIRYCVMNHPIAAEPSLSSFLRNTAVLSCENLLAHKRTDMISMQGYLEQIWKIMAKKK